MRQRLLRYILPGLLLLPAVTLQAQKLNWVEIPAGTTDAQLQEMIKAEVSSQISDKKFISFTEKAPAYHSYWQAEKQKMEFDWRQGLHKREVDFREGLAKVTDTRHNYVDFITRLDVAGIQLKARRSTLESIQNKLRAVQQEQAANERNLQVQLKDIPLRVMMMGTAKVGSGNKVTVQTIKEQLGLGMKFKAIESVNGIQVKSFQEIQNHRVVSARLLTEKLGRAEVIGVYPMDINPNQFNQGTGEMLISHYLFHTLEVYPFQDVVSGGTVRYTEVKDLVLDLPIEFRVLNERSDLTAFAGLGDANLNVFVSQWIESNNHHNKAIESRIRDIRLAYQSKSDELKGKLAGLQGDKKKSECELVAMVMQFHGVDQMTEEEVRMKDACNLHEPKEASLSEKLKVFEETEWKPAIQNLKEQKNEYYNWYSKRKIWLNKVEDGKLGNDQTPESTWQSVAMKAFGDVKAEEGGLSLSESVLVVGGRLDDHRQKVIQYQIRPSRFALVYISSEMFRSQTVFLANLGFEYQLTPGETMANGTFEEALPKLSSKGLALEKMSRCTDDRLQMMIDFGIPAKTIAQKCGLRD